MLYFKGKVEANPEKMSISKDQIDGQVTKELESSKRFFDIDEQVHAKFADADLDVEANKVISLAFKLTKNEHHLSKILEGTDIPPRVVEDFAIFHVNRRHFQGETAIRIVEEVLKIDTSQDPVYNLRARQNNYRPRGQMHENGLVDGGF